MTRQRATRARRLWNGVKIHRVFRPPWTQKRPVPRPRQQRLDAGGLVRARGPARAVRRRGDRLRPVVRASLAIPLRAAWRRTPLLHWCLDVFPDAGEAEWTGATRLLSPPARAVMSAAYRCCDVVVDLGPCMRRAWRRTAARPRARR
jgi:hypothetical protein